MRVRAQGAKCNVLPYKATWSASFSNYGYRGVETISPARFKLIANKAVKVRVFSPADWSGVDQDYAASQRQRQAEEQVGY